MKITITEDQLTRLRRRGSTIDKLVEYMLNQLDVCRYDNPDQFYRKVMNDLSEMIVTYNNEEQTGLETGELISFIGKYRKDEIIMHFIKEKENCPHIK
jgi:hypothetical protein